MKLIITCRNRSRQCLLAGLLIAAQGAWSAEDLQLVSIQRLIPERGAVNGIRLISATHKSSLIIPSGWRSEGDLAGKKVVLQAEDYGATCDVSQSAAVKGRKLTWVDLQELALQRAPTAKILAAHESASRLGPIYAITLAEENADGLRLYTEVVFIVQPDRTVTFTLVARGDQPDKYRKALETMLASFRDD